MSDRYQVVVGGTGWWKLVDTAYDIIIRSGTAKHRLEDRALELNDNEARTAETRNEIADAIEAETRAAAKDIVSHYGHDYARAWIAGRTQAAEEIRKS
jgi:hypothetical protein